MKKLMAVLLALALLGAAAMAEGAAPEPTPDISLEPTVRPVGGVYLPPLSEAFITPEPTPTPDPVEVARQALIAQVTGEWYLNAFILDGASYAPELFGNEMTLYLMEEAEAAADYGEDHKPGEGIWDVQEDRILVTIGDITREFTYNEVADTLTTDIDGGSMVLGRERIETAAFEPAEPIEAELEAFAGDWRTYQIGVGGAYFDTALFGQEITANIEETTISVTGYVFSGLSAQAEYEEGILRFTGADDEGGMFDSVAARLLADDSLSLTISAGSDGFELIMSRVEQR